LAASGHLHPVVAALLMVGSSTVVAWRSLRPAHACEPPGPASPNAPAGRSAQTVVPATSAFTARVVAVSLLAQIPWIAWLGHLRATDAGAISAVLLFLAWFTPRVFRSATPRPVATMALAMLGPGNLGMLVGWWMDAGFGPVMRDGVCLCCQSHHYFTLG